MILNELTSFLESIAPLALQESYDNAGLIIGDSSKKINKAIISLDCTEAVIGEAISSGANLIISHHPIIFSGLKKITGKNYIERVVIKAIKNDIAIYAIHTNLDNVADGVNNMICDQLGLINRHILSPKNNFLKKLVTYCPSDSVEKVRKAIFDAGAGHIGNYTACSFNAPGYGTFTPGNNTQPFVGKKGEAHKEAELRIETIYPAWIEGELLKALVSAHPYEEVAYDLISLDNSNMKIGSGMYAELTEETDTLTFLKTLKKKMHCESIRHTTILKPKIKKIAVCGGSGSFLLNDAIKCGADLFITADYKYHQFFDADSRIVIADIGHYESEQFTSELLLSKIRNKFPTFAVRICDASTNPVHYL